jgi:hypothetical protein
MACGGCAKRRAERAALREQRIQEKIAAREAAAAEQQKSLTAAAQK